MLRRCTNRLPLDVVRRRRASSHPPYFVPDKSRLRGRNPRPAPSTPGAPALTRRQFRLTRADATVIAWHRQGFRLFWTWKSRRRLGRPSVPAELRSLIRQMSDANPLWGAPRIHGELLELGIDVSQATVTKYVSRRQQPPSPTWRTFLANHAAQIMAADVFVVPTASTIATAPSPRRRYQVFSRDRSAASMPLAPGCASIRVLSGAEEKPA
jgi:hypothetical protein